MNEALGIMLRIGVDALFSVLQHYTTVKMYSLAVLFVCVCVCVCVLNFDLSLSNVIYS